MIKNTFFKRFLLATLVGLTFLPKAFSNEQSLKELLEAIQVAKPGEIVVFVAKNVALMRWRFGSGIYAYNDEIVKVRKAAEEAKSLLIVVDREFPVDLPSQGTQNAARDADRAVNLVLDSELAKRGFTPFLNEVSVETERIDHLAQEIINAPNDTIDILVTKNIGYIRDGDKKAILVRPILNTLEMIKAAADQSHKNIVIMDEEITAEDTNALVDKLSKILDEGLAKQNLTPAYKAPFHRQHDPAPQPPSENKFLHHDPLQRG